MTRKDYERAATLIRDMYRAASGNDNLTSEVTTTKEAFIIFFRDDNPHFKERRFRAACDGDEP